MSHLADLSKLEPFNILGIRLTESQYIKVIEYMNDNKLSQITKEEINKIISI